LTDGPSKRKLDRPSIKMLRTQKKRTSQKKEVVRKSPERTRARKVYQAASESRRKAQKAEKMGDTSKIVRAKEGVADL